MSPTASLRFDLDALVAGAVWSPFRAGIEVSILHGELGVGAAAALLRYQPGASLPTHLHLGFEHVLVLSGAQTDEHGEYGRGSFVVNPPQSRHTVSSPRGCIVLVTWEQPVQFIE